GKIFSDTMDKEEGDEEEEDVAVVCDIVMYIFKGSKIFMMIVFRLAIQGECYDVLPDVETS
ncbi:hypothetical protein L195_g043951, partial [Trifolium pratense]